MMADTPVRQGYLEAQAGWSNLSGVYARLEGGAKLAPRLGVFAFGEWRPLETMAGIGARLMFDL